MENCFVAGLDVGQMSDPAALCIVQVAASSDSNLADYHVRHAERFPLGLPYPEMVKQFVARLGRPEIQGRCMVVIDATGVGAAVVDMVRSMVPVPCCAVTIHGGELVIPVSGGYRVPKRDLVSVVQVLLQQGRLKIASGMAGAPMLVEELSNFRYKITSAVHDVYGAWREGEHDDLVLAVALAVWWCEMAPYTVTRVTDYSIEILPWV
jgi:hypothetical protein